MTAVAIYVGRRGYSFSHDILFGMDSHFREIYLAADHAGFQLKETVREWLREESLEVVDVGAFELNTEDDFPPLMIEAATRVAESPESRAAILFGGSGQGEAMAANRIPGVRGTVYYGGPLEIITLSREHNQANVLSLGARFLSESDAKAAIALWLKTSPSSEEKYHRRNRALDELIKEDGE